MADMNDRPAIIAQLDVSSGLRTACVIVLSLAGGVLIARAFETDAGTVQQIGGGILAVCVFALVHRIHRRTPSGLVLTTLDLRTTGGDVIAPLGNIAQVNRAAFGFRPQGGFSLRLRDATDPAFVPGVYLRYGRWVGIGGMTPRHPTKALAIALETAIAARGTV